MIKKGLISFVSKKLILVAFGAVLTAFLFKSNSKSSMLY